MNLDLDISLTAGYSSASQRARLMSEDWVARNGYCLACDSDRLRQTSTNTQARDFECIICGHPYELKSTLGRFGKQVADGAYSSMMRRIESSTAASFLLLEYSRVWTVSRFFAIHHLLITPSAIRARKPLSPSARRAGWIGCNIQLEQIPKEGRIDIVQLGEVIPKIDSRAQFSQNEKLLKLSIAERTWTVTVLRIIEKQQARTFTLAEVYANEAVLKVQFPANAHIKEKLRQQLQVLRDLGYVEFVSRGHYRLKNISSIVAR